MDGGVQARGIAMKCTSQEWRVRGYPQDPAKTSSGEVGSANHSWLMAPGPKDLAETLPTCDHPQSWKLISKFGLLQPLSSIFLIRRRL